MSSFLDTIDEHWWLGLPAAISFFLAHFVDFTAGWATVLYWFLFGLTVFSVVSAVIIGFVTKKIKRKELVKPDFWYPWSFVIPVCITFAWLPDNNIFKSLMTCHLAFFAGAWLVNWNYFVREYRKPPRQLPVVQGK